MTPSSPPAAGRPSLRPWLDRWGRSLLVAASLALIVALWAARTTAVRHGLRGYREAHSADFREREFPGLNARELVLLGTAHSTDNRPAGSYTRVPEAKPPGTIRIGVFGCSFVRGAEVGPGADFPSRLGAALADLGSPGVEVINFGVGGYGMHQSVLLWELVGRRYHLDYTLFHLHPFHEARDAGFLLNPDEFAPVHARYVLRDGEAVRVDPVGETRLEAAETYSSFLAPWRYARFDVRGPALLRALLPRGKTLGRNPFYYYRGDLGAESRELYPALFARIVEAGGRGVIVTCNGDACRHAEALRARGVEVLEMRASVLALGHPSLYRAPLGHLSALGNELVAEELAASLRGRAARLHRIELEPLPHADPPASAPQRLRNGHRPELWIGPRRVAALFGGGPRATPGEPFRPRGAKALLDVSRGQEIAFLPLNQPLGGNESIELAFRLDGRPVTAPLGTVEVATPVLGRPRWLGGAGGDGWSVASAIDLTGVLALRTERRVDRLTVRLGGRPLLRGEERPARDGVRRFRLRPVGRSTPVARADALSVPSARDLPESGTVDLVFAFRNPERNRGPLPRIPIAAYRRTAVEIEAPEPPLARPLPGSDPAADGG